jgi:hypothetical protein
VFTPITRRGFVTRTLQAGAAVGLADFGFLSALPAIAADQANASPKTVQLHADIEPLVRLIEDTDRSKLIEVAVERIRGGTSYQQLLSAVLLAGVRGIKPRPVGFQFHAVLVVNSARLASEAARDNDRWLPLLWALDNFKISQATNKEKNAGWMMPPVEEAKLPAAHQARQRFIEAMDDWNEEGSDRAIAALTRSAGAGEIIELLWRYGARDFRDIGHKAIYVANSWRTLQVIGWRHAEPVLRSLAFALLQHEGDNPAKRDAEADRPWRENIGRAAKINANWQEGKLAPDATKDLLAALRTGTPSDAADKVVELLNKGVAPASVWDGLFLTAGELLMRQPGIVGIHCVTSANALHQGYLLSGNDETRKMMMLQAAAFLVLFRKAMGGRGKLRDDVRIDTLEKVATKEPEAEVAEVLADVSKNRQIAAQKTLALLDGKTERAETLMAAARRLLFSKGDNSHDYKFASASLEDYYNVTPAWRDRYLATSMFNLRGSGDRDNDLMNRTRAALAKG